MAKRNYIGVYYRGDGTRENRSRWGVYSIATETWTFPKRYGEKAVHQLAKRMNEEAL